MRKFADIHERIDSEKVISRVLALAELLYESEVQELENLQSRNALKEFQIQVAPKSITLAIIDGLTRYLNAIYEQADSIGRDVIQPSNVVLEEINQMRIKASEIEKAIRG